MSVMRQAVGTGEGTSLRLRGRSPMHSGARFARRDVIDVNGEVVWRVRSGSVQAGAMQAAHAKLRGVQSDADLALAFVLSQDGARCELRSASACVCVQEGLDAKIDVCDETGLAHVRVLHNADVLLIATLRHADGVWRAMYAQTPLLASSGAGGGRYEVERE